MTNQSIAYFLLRITLGVDFLMHGLTRITHYQDFVIQLAASFQASPLPSILVWGFGYTVPPVEVLIGLFLILGLFTRYTLIVGALWMIALLFGISLRQDWNVAALQLGYSVIFFILLFLMQHNRISLDGYRGKNLEI